MGVVISGWLGMPFPLPGVLSALIPGLWTFFFFFFKITPLAQTYCMALGAVSSFGHLTW